MLSPATVSQLNAKLQAFERETSDQVIVYIAPTLPGDYALEDFTHAAFRSWGVGQKAKNNGVALFIFPQSRKMRIEVGYGLEGVLPDARAKQIISNSIAPAFKRGDFNAGVTAGVDAILKNIRGEYQGTGRTHQEETQAYHAPPPESSLVGILPLLFFGFIGLIIFLNMLKTLARGTTYTGRRRRDTWYYPTASSGSDTFFGGSSSGWSSGGGSSSDSGGSSGGFSGGGGDSGGGGASGSW